MNVQLDDGTIVTDVPEGTTQRDLMARVTKMRGAESPSPPARIGAPEPLTWAERNIAPVIEKAMPNGRIPIVLPTPIGPSIRLGTVDPRNNPVTQGLADPGTAIMQIVGNAAGHGDAVNRVVRDNERAYQESRGADADTFDPARLATNVLNPVPFKLVAGIKPAATVAGRVAQNAGIGGTLAAATPATRDSNFLREKLWQVGAGSLLGPVIPVAARAIGGAANAARNIIEPWLPGGTERIAARTATEAAGPRAESVIAALKSAQELVPGSKPIAGEAAVPAGSAEFAGLQKTASETLPSEYRDIAKTQDAARLAAVRSVGKDKAALAEAETQRAANAQQNYAKAFEQEIRADPELAVLSKIPYFQDALPDAMKLAAAKGIDPKSDLTQFLHIAKLSLDKQLSRSGDTALSNTEKAAVQSVKSQLVDWLGKKNPAYEAARAQFAAESGPIDRMRVGQHLESKLEPAVNDFAEGAAKQRAAAYSTAVREAPATIDQATGQARTSLDQVLTPDEVKAIQGVGADLARTAAFEDMARLGGPAAREISGTKAVQLPNMLNHAVSITNAVLRRIQGRAGAASMEELSRLMQNPQELAAAMERAKPADRAALADGMQLIARLASGAAGAESARHTPRGAQETRPAPAVPKALPARPEAPAATPGVPTASQAQSARNAPPRTWNDPKLGTLSFTGNYAAGGGPIYIDSNGARFVGKFD